MAAAVIGDARRAARSVLVVGVLAVGAVGGGLSAGDEAAAVAVRGEADSTWIAQADPEPDPDGDTSGQEHEDLSAQLGDLLAAIEAGQEAAAQDREAAAQDREAAAEARTAAAEARAAQLAQLEALTAAVGDLGDGSTLRDLDDGLSGLANSLDEQSASGSSSESESLSASESGSTSSVQSGACSDGGPFLISQPDLSPAASWDWLPPDSASSCSYLVHDPATLQAVARTRTEVLLAASLIVLLMGATLWLAGRRA